MSMQVIVKEGSKQGIGWIMSIIKSMQNCFDLSNELLLNFLSCCCLCSSIGRKMNSTIAYLYNCFLQCATYMCLAVITITEIRVRAATTRRYLLAQSSFTFAILSFSIVVCELMMSKSCAKESSWPYMAKNKPATEIRLAAKSNPLHILYSFSYIFMDNCVYYLNFAQCQLFSG
ncbi:hypothetical protein FGO68_gene16515 [Halteria grandinella]|uniref:Uncharacterized protein n=1 Tax=Halteria grandinella TaxID=5974 RepID=A0A8J8T7T9_HALGN|nr:hypothetical protein FGO68_gene16515 [Halteria grandinella]